MFFLHLSDRHAVLLAFIVLLLSQSFNLALELIVFLLLFFVYFLELCGICLHRLAYFIPHFTCFGLCFLLYVLECISCSLRLCSDFFVLFVRLFFIFLANLFNLRMYPILFRFGFFALLFPLLVD